VTTRETIERVVYGTVMCMDAQDFKGYMALCDSDYHYKITAHSPEIRKDMIWLEHNRAGMELLFKNLPKHNSDHSTLTRHVTIYTIDVDEAKGEASVTSSLQVFRTALDGGITELYAVGKQYDTVKFGGDKAALTDRHIHLHTRGLGIGHHVPF
jgi:methanesulfonate monooxygenase small subunit